jgi:hypothetical protein
MTPPGTDPGPRPEVEHAELVKAMRRPDFYPHPVDEVGYLQTHVSSVFLTGRWAYKLKKPVDFGFLDFTTPELRREACRKELELNRRLAPDVYREVKAVTMEGDEPVLGGEGRAVDWVVVMRQLEQELLGPNVLAAGELTEEKIDAVVDLLVPFYRNAWTGPGVDEFGSVETIRFNTNENFEQTADFVGRALTGEQYEEIRSFTDSFLEEEEELLRRRVEEGRIRECHGDLHLGNIFFSAPPVIFDCIEFNERFRCSDVAVDLAFLVMDLDFQGRPELARRVVERYVEGSGDTELPDLIDFYACYRAYVRGKIACLTSRDPALDEEAREGQIQLARRYFDLAHRYASGGDGERDA